jgi:hypothetical protein
MNYLQFLSDYLTKIRTTNITEWTNKELKRRNKVVGYSIAGMILRLSVSILIGIDEDWIIGNTYNNNGTVLKKEDSRASSRFSRK